MSQKYFGDVVTLEQMNNNNHTVILHRDLNTPEASKAFSEALREHVNAESGVQRHLVVNLNGHWIGSGDASALTQLHKNLGRKTPSEDMEVVGVSNDVAELFQITGLDKVFPVQLQDGDHVTVGSVTSSSNFQTRC